VKRQFVDILQGSLAAVSQSQTADRDATVRRSSSTFSLRRRCRLRQHSLTPQDASSTCSSSPESKRRADWQRLDTQRSAAVAAAAETTKTTAMHRSCAAAVLACSTRTKPPPDSQTMTDRRNDDPHRRLPRPFTRRMSLSARRRLSSANKENVAAAADNARYHTGVKLSGDCVSVGPACKPDVVAYRRLFPELREVKEEEASSSSLVRTSSVVDTQRQATSSTLTLHDVSAITRASDSDGDGGVLHRVRSTTSTSSLNGAFCSSTADADDDDATTASAAAAGAFCSTFSYPLHSTVIDSFFDVSALLPARPVTSSDNRHGLVEASSPRQLDQSSQQYSTYQRTSETQCRQDGLLFDNVDRPPNLLLQDDVPSCQFVDRRPRPDSTSVDPLSASSATELHDFARTTTNDSNCTARLRRQMGQTRLYNTTNNSSSSQRQSDFTSSRLNVDDDNDCSRSTLFECGCAVERRFQRLPTAGDFNVLPPTSTNFSLSRSHHRRYAEHLESQAYLTDSCRSWTSDRRRMTMHCPPVTRTEALLTADRPTDCAVRHDRYRTISHKQRLTDDRAQPGYSSSHRRAALDERLTRRQRVAPGPVGSGVGGCPLCGCGRKPVADGATRRSSRTSKLTSSNCDDAAAERRRKRELLRKLRRFSDAFYGNRGGLQLKTFGHL